PGRFGGEERFEDFLAHLREDVGAVVSDAYFYGIAQVAGGDCQRWFEAGWRGGEAFARGVETVAYQVQQDPCELLRVRIDHPRRRIEVFLQRDVEPGSFRPRAVV